MLVFKKLLYFGAGMAVIIVIFLVVSARTKVLAPKAGQAVPGRAEGNEIFSDGLMAPNGLAAVALVKKAGEESHKFRGGEDTPGPTLAVFDEIVIADQETGRTRKIDLIQLVPKSLEDALNGIEGYVPFNARPVLLKWSADSRDIWGALYLWVYDEKPNSFAALFKVEAATGNVEKHALPGHWVEDIDPQQLNLERNALLITSVNPNTDEMLFLNIYDLHTQKTTKVVSYSKTVFGQNYAHDPMTYLYGDCHPESDDRQFHAQWGDKDTISYLDFVTRKRVIAKY